MKSRHGEIMIKYQTNRQFFSYNTGLHCYIEHGMRRKFTKLHTSHPWLAKQIKSKAVERLQTKT